MSRKPSDPSTKLKISNPQPYQPPNAFANRNLSDYRPAPVPGSGSTVTGRASPAPGPAPARPARSVRRAPDPPAQAPGSFPSILPVTSLPTSESSKSTPQPTLLQIPPANNDYDLPVSPISPMDGPQRIQPSSTTTWESERNQRSHLLQAQQQNVERENKLQNAVKAFSAGSKGKAPERSALRKPSGANGSRLHDELMIGHGGRDFDDVDSVLRKIQREWPFVLEPDFASTSLALSLLPPTKDETRGSTPYGSQNLESFMEIQSLLSDSLSKAVQNHYQVYAASLPQHANLVTALNRAQGVVKDTKKKLIEGRELLSGRTEATVSGAASGKRSEMVALWHKERALREMLKTLDTIENLKAVPDRLETLIADKKFIAAALILTRAIRTINKDEMMEIGALADLRTYLIGQQNVLVDILLDELSNHLYLKIHYCDGRWVPYQPGQTHLPIPKDQVKDMDDIETARRGSAGSIDKSNSRLSRFLQNLSHKPNRDPILNLSDDELMSMPAIPPRANRRDLSVYGGDTTSIAAADRALQEERESTVSGNPELDSYAYMAMCLEALAILDRLGPALEAISQRIANELFKLVESTIEEASDRAELRKAEASAEAAPQNNVEEGDVLINGELNKLKRASMTATAANAYSRHQRLRMDSLERGGSEPQSFTLLDLFWTVYSKFRAVLEGQRVVSEVVSRIAMTSSYSSKRQAFTAIPTEDFVKPMQKEVRALLRDYLTDTNRNATSNRKPVSSINDMMRNGKAARDKQRAVFRFGDTDTKTISKDLDKFEQSLTQAMQIHVPGLVTMTDNGIQARLAVTQLNEDGTSLAKTHKLLVSPDPFNVSILFQPYLAFVTSARETINMSSLDEEHGEIGHFMDDFIQKVYLPQLEEKVTNLFQQAANGPTAFLRDVNWSRWSPFPIVNAGTQTMALVNSLCYMLETTPFQRENYSRLILGIIVQFYQKSNSHYKDIVASDSYTDGRLPLAASWSQREDILANLGELQHSPAADVRARENLSREENKLELPMLPRDHKGLEVKDIIGTKEKFAALADLYYTTRWIVARLRELKRVGEDLVSPGGAEQSAALDVPPPTSPTDKPALDLTMAMSQRFDAILSTYEQFGDMVLYTLRIELRCRLMFYIQSSMSKTNYRAENTDDEPDPHVQDLTNDLSQCESIVQVSIPPGDRDFLFVGLDSLADTVLVSSGRFVRSISDSGLRKIERNIAAIQQALRNMLSGGSRIVLSNCRRYWQLYNIGPQALINLIQERGPEYTFDEYNHMLTLQCKIDVRAETRATNRLSLLPGQQQNGMTSGQKTFDSDRTAYNDALIELHSFFM